MSANNNISPAQEKLLAFFSPLELPDIHRHFKDIFRVAAFESEITKNDGGKDSLYTLYSLIELVEELK